MIYRTLDSSWGRAGNRHLDLNLPLFERALERDAGHALCGPLLIRGAQPGDMLEIHIQRIIPAHWGGRGLAPAMRQEMDLDSTRKWS
ncbi:MAG: hypothetical protein ABI068_11385 [Ktedonobacterales bacterium]